MTRQPGPALGVFAIAAALVCAAIAPAPAQSRATRIVAIGDVHGSLDGLRAILASAGLIGADGHWSGGGATLVQTGDLTDRGADVRGVLDLVRQLEREASNAGGRVVSLLGNHEVMNLVGELRDVTPAICASFAGADADAVRQRAWQDYRDLVRERDRRRKGETPPGLPRTEQTFLAAYPPGCIEYRKALGPSGEYGRWLRGHPIAARIDRTVFMHAGAAPQTLASLDEINATARAELERVDRVTDRLVRARLVLPWFRLDDVLGVAAAEVRWFNAQRERAKAAGNASALEGIDVALVKDAADLLDIGTWSLLKGDGPLWYRGYATAADVALDTIVPAFLTRWNAERIVVGHSVTPDFRIHARLGGRVVLIDTGMLTPVYNGRASALEIDGANLHALYGDGERVALAPLP